LLSPWAYPGECQICFAGKGLIKSSTEGMFAMIMALKDAVRRTKPSVPSRTTISDRMTQIRTVWSAAERQHRADLSLVLQLQLLAKCGEASLND
jgi:hypothetical protein